ncbi:MAG: PHB depolymerase family esterase, partial [Pseudomonadota bacterium]
MRRTTRRMGAAAALFCAVLTAGSARPAGACSGPEAPCETGLGRYVLVLPPQAAPEAPVPALVYLHGWGASPSGVLNGRAGMAEALSKRGYALILPEGVPRAGRTQRDWSVADGGRHPRQDIAFLDEIIADAAGRGVDTDRLMLAGFSRGGSMVWDVACQ